MTVTTIGYGDVQPGNNTERYAGDASCARAAGSRRVDRTVVMGLGPARNLPIRQMLCVRVCVQDHRFVLYAVRRCPV